MAQENQSKGSPSVLQLVIVLRLKCINVIAGAATSQQVINDVFCIFFTPFSYE